jgi:TonB family protein
VENPSNRLARRRWRTAAMIALLALASASPAFAEMKGLRPITRENPVYPYAALTNGIEGWVLVEYTVNERGHVVTPRILEANPPGVFDRAALRALSRWRYEPHGAEPRTMKVRLTFRR